jgi:hypothetical protein
MDWIFWGLLAIPVSLLLWLTYYLIKHRGDFIE